MSLATPTAIRTLQRKLYRKAKTEPAFRFYLLHDKIYREDILRHAYALARANAGAPGVDGMTFAAIEALGLDGWLAGLREELISKTYRPDPVRRAGRRRATARHSDDPGSSGSDRRQACAGTDL
jgi:RNA-directed DNA polymerase